MKKFKKSGLALPCLWKRAAIIPALLLALLLAACSAQEAESGYRQITMDEAVALMAEQEDYLILDVRTFDEYNEKHIPNAICVPNENIGTEEVAELPDKEQLNRSKQAAEKLAALGYTQIVEFGGIKDWPGETVSELESVEA